jgi:hypothetical protein
MTNRNNLQRDLGSYSLKCVELLSRNTCVGDGRKLFLDQLNQMDNLYYFFSLKSSIIESLLIVRHMTHLTRYNKRSWDQTETQPQTQPFDTLTNLSHSHPIRQQFIRKKEVSEESW